MRTHVTDGLTTTSHLRLIRRSLLESWPVTAEEKAKAVEFIAGVIENANGECTPKQILTASRILLLMSNSNVKNALNLEKQALIMEKFNVLDSMESMTSNCLAEGRNTCSTVSH